MSQTYSLVMQKAQKHLNPQMWHSQLLGLVGQLYFHRGFDTIFP